MLGTWYLTCDRTAGDVALVPVGCVRGMRKDAGWKWTLGPVRVGVGVDHKGPSGCSYSQLVKAR